MNFQNLDQRNFSLDVAIMVGASADYCLRKKSWNNWQSIHWMKHSNSVFCLEISVIREVLKHSYVVTGNKEFTIGSGDGVIST